MGVKGSVLKPLKDPTNYEVLSNDNGQESVSRQKMGNLLCYGSRDHSM